MTDQTDRLALPLLSSGQAQKEVTHNEALALADILVQPVVQAIAPSSIPPSPSLGQCWIVGVGATGAWAGHDGALAGWTSGGWRFVSPFVGMTVWSVADGMAVRRTATAWEIGGVNAKSFKVDAVQVLGARQAAIADPGGGVIVDTEARIAVTAILARMRTHGLISA